MINIIKAKSHMISKLFIFQFASSLLGFFVVSPFSGYWQVGASIFATLFYFSLICYAVIEDGQKDYVSVSAGRMEGNAYSGFVYGSVAYLPTILIVAFQVMIQFLSSGLESLKAILGLLIRFFLMGMYLGYDTGLVQRFENPDTHEKVIKAGSDVLVFMSDHYLIFAICLVFLPVMCGVSYLLAYNGLIHVDTSVKHKEPRWAKKDK